MKGLFITLILLTAGGAGAWKVWGADSSRAEGISQSAIATVRRDDLKITVIENGYLKSKKSVKIKPEIRRSGTITWLIEEGEQVEEGAILCELEKTELQNQISDLENSLIQYESELEAATANLEIQKRDNTAAVEKADTKLLLAELAMKRFDEGEAPNELRKKELAAEKAESEFQRATERFEQVPELHSEGFLTKIQVEEERIRLREAEINMENMRRELDLYKDYTAQMNRTEKVTALKDARRELENSEQKAVINLKEKESQVSQKQRQLKQNNDRLTELRKELDGMTIKAPQPGIVHYGDPGRPWERDQIKVGNNISRGRTLITLPDLSEMQVLIQVHEAEIDLVEEDMPVVITIETHKGKAFPGKVTEIASVASNTNWSDDNNKSFRVEVSMDPTEIELRSGVSARVEVQVEVLPDVILVPMHAVYPDGEHHLAFVLGEGGTIEERRVEIDKHNAHHVQVVSGLAEGEEVLLYDPRDEGSVPSGGEGEGAGEDETDDAPSGMAGAMGGA